MMDIIKDFQYLVRHSVYGIHIHHTVEVIEATETHTKVRLLKTTNDRMQIGKELSLVRGTSWLTDYTWTPIEPVYEDVPLVLSKDELEYMIELALATHDKEWFNELTQKMEVSQ